MLLDDVPVLEDEVVLLNALFHHPNGSTLQLSGCLPLLQRSLGLLGHLVQFLLVLQHQQFLLDLQKLLGGRKVQVSSHGINFGDFDLLLGCFREDDELFGVDVVAPSLSSPRLQLPLLLNELLVALTFDHSYFITNPNR